jgi:uncharacterized protein
MLKQIKVVPLAEESLGGRSLSTFVQTKDVKILLDAGASLAPSTQGCLPHPREYLALAECRKKIEVFAGKSDVVTVSHYHFDHHTPSYVDWFSNWSSVEAAKRVYEGKVVLVKSFRSFVNASQRRRGWMFSKTSGGYAKRLEFADGRSFVFGGTKVRFSEPVFHGVEGSGLGWVLMTVVEVGDERFVFAPDVQGPMFTPTLDRLLAEFPQLVVVGGPPTYLEAFRVKPEDIETGLRNLERLVENVPVTVLGHHVLRDENWENRCQPVFDAANRAGNKVVTAAEFLGVENRFLEFRRRQLFETEPPGSGFREWMSLPLQKRRLVKPPV